MTRIIRMTSAATYSICVQGSFPGNWADWFENTTIRIEAGQGEDIRTNLTCRVKDQAALLGILMKLNGLNVPIISVSVLEQSESDQRAEEKGVST